MIKFVEVSRKRREACEPIIGSMSFGEVQVAGTTFRELQLDAYRKAMDINAGSAKESVYYMENALVCSKTMTDLLSVALDKAAVVSDGELLAYKGACVYDDSFDIIEATEDDYLIRYSWDFLKLNEDFLKSIQTDISGVVHSSAVIDGEVIVGEGTRILPGVYIEGNAVFGRNCKIGPNCYIRGNTFVGDGCHIGQSVEVKNSIIMNGSSLGHLSYCGDSIIAQNVNFGAGTTTSNFRHDGCNHKSMIDGELIDTGRRKFGMIIGANVHTGINTSFYPGRKVWPGRSTRPGDIVQKDLK